MSKSLFLKQWNIRPFFFNLWQLSVLLDSLVCRALWLRKMMEHYLGYEVYCHINPNVNMSYDSSLFFDRNETLWGKLLALNGWKNKINLLPNPYSKVQIGKKNIKSLIRLFLKTYL